MTNLFGRNSWKTWLSFAYHSKEADLTERDIDVAATTTFSSIKRKTWKPEEKVSLFSFLKNIILLEPCRIHTKIEKKRTIHKTFINRKRIDMCTRFFFYLFRPAWNGRDKFLHPSEVNHTVRDIYGIDYRTGRSRCPRSRQECREIR